MSLRGSSVLTLVYWYSNISSSKFVEDRPNEVLTAKVSISHISHDRVMGGDLSFRYELFSVQTLVEVSRV